MINFLAEISIRFDREIHLTPSNGVSRKKNIYELDIGEAPDESYWLDWGGTYDHFQGTQIEMYLGDFLTKVYAWSHLLARPNSLYVREDLMVFVNIPNHPWLYPQQSIEAQNVKVFLYSALNPNKPSNSRIKGANASTRLTLPNLTVKLSDNINGIVLNQGFSISLINNDGYFDNEEKWNIFNTPLRLKKATADNPEYDDFKDIRVGLVENAVTNFDDFQIDAGDRFRTMENPVCAIITSGRFLGVEIDEKTINKNIPIVYGRRKIKLLKLNDTDYVAAEYISQIISIHDKDENVVSYTFNAETGIITSTGNPDNAVIVGYTDNKIGDIIKDLVTRKAGIPYLDANWNMDETERYLQTSPRINIIIESGNVKNAIQSVLKNDMAFFIQRYDGLFTIRKYGTEYATHKIPSWAVTKKPEKTWGTAQENYFSSCVINYDVNGDEFKSLLYNDRSYEAEDTYRRLVRREFDTDLTNQDEAAALASVLSDRYSTMLQTLKLPVGIDTSTFQLLDRVTFDAGINNRKFSKGEYFIIKEIDPAQDILTIEEIHLWDIDGELYNTADEDYEYDVDGMYAYTPDDEYKYILDGGIM